MAAVYTVALVLIVGGGGDEKGGAQPVAGAGTTTAKPLDPEEKKVAEKVEGAKVKVAESSDVAAYRKPNVQSVECKDGKCTIVYTSGLPGRGRIFEDQQRMLAEIFEDEAVDEVVLRGLPRRRGRPEDAGQGDRGDRPGDPDPRHHLPANRRVQARGRG